MKYQNIEQFHDMAFQAAEKPDLEKMQVKQEKKVQEHEVKYKNLLQVTKRQDLQQKNANEIAKIQRMFVNLDEAQTLEKLARSHQKLNLTEQIKKSQDCDFEKKTRMSEKTEYFQVAWAGEEALKKNPDPLTQNL